jgi:deferrochelatase/peroxidase EfeB
MSLKPAIRSDIDVRDIQAIVWSGFDSLKGGRYMLLRVNDAQAARQWLGDFKPTSFGDLYDEDGASKHCKEVIQVALTAAGLRTLGINGVDGFSLEFKEGMASDRNRNRSLRLGDTGANAPENWAWGYGDNEPHILLIMFATDVAHVEALAMDQRTGAELSGLAVIDVLPTSDLGDEEPFGFTDGVSQPSFDWDVPRKPGTSADRDYTNLLALGELLLGYRNEYGLLTERPSVPANAKDLHLPSGVHPPDRRDLGRNGTYLVFRQLEQDVRGFWRWIGDEARRVNVKPGDLAEAMVGRKRNGDPLDDLTRGRSIPGIDAAAGERNGFLYDTDPDGLSCPLGAHIRRANPRTGDAPGGRRGWIDNLLVMIGLTMRRRKNPTSSTLPWPLNSTIWPFVRLQDDAVASARFHRILRRGREYGNPPRLDQPATEKEDPTGLHFLCLNANIARQFEFVQGAWIASAKFAALSGEQDPLLGNRQPFPEPPVAAAPQMTDGFSRPGAPPNCKYSSGLPQFVTVRGGAYFFLPGLAALKWIVSD